MNSVTWVLKPGASGDRLATLARDLDALRHASPVDIRDFLRDAQQAAAELFLDPAVPGMLHSPSDFGAYDDLLTNADRVATAVHSLLSDDAVAFDPDLIATWPTEVRGGERLLHYRLIRNLGEGGMGNVCLAWDERLDRHVALKRLADHNDVERGYRRLEREARAAARLRHANIVITYALEYVRSEPMLALEYIEGTDLQSHVGSSLSAQDAIRMMTEIAAGLAAAHAAGVIHRDLKPQNIRLRPDGTAVILDFGLGKVLFATPDERTQVQLTEDGDVLGTPLYMSPEQLRAAALTPASDVFSFGVVCYQLLTGRAPFSGDTRPSLFAAILHAAPEPIDDIAGVPRHVTDLVIACLQKSTRERPTMADVLEQLRGTTTAITVPEVGNDARFLEHFSPDDVCITEHPDRNAIWVQAQRERGRTGLEAQAVTFELAVVFTGTKPEVPLGQMKRLLTTIQHADPDVLIGRVSEDERTKLHRGSTEVYARFPFENMYGYWAAARDGRFFYLTRIPLLAGGRIPIEFLLGQTIVSLQYVARYAALFAIKDTRLTIDVDLHNASGHLLVGQDWSHRFTASLDALNKRADETTRSTLAVALPFLQRELSTCIKVLFDDLMTSFDFVTIPMDYYHHVFSEQ